MTLSTSASLPAAGAVPAWHGWITASGVSLLALSLYGVSAAPGLTWAHQGADGGELLAAAVVNGVPHPPGYPLYMPMLQIWLALSGWLMPAGDPAARGNALSALCAALSVGITVLTAGHLVRSYRRRWLWAGLAGATWAVCPLLWSQAVITEVYALHALLLALLGHAVLVHPTRVWYVCAVITLGVAHHLTFVLLLPAALYVVCAQAGSRRAWLRWIGWFVLAGAVGMLFYLRIPLVAGSGPPPVNWGYANNLDGFWWLVSGAAYRGYLFTSPSGTLYTRISAWAYTITTQYSPIGLAIALAGLAQWDREAPFLRNFSLLWLVPVSVYAIGYFTRDSEIYLLPVAWIMALWLGLGLAAGAAWIERRAELQQRWAQPAIVALALLTVLVLVAWRWPSVALDDDHEAREYLAEVAAILEPNSIVVTLGDQPTFAIWYGTWGSGELALNAPGLVPANDSLYQFEWYRRLQGDLYPEIPGIDRSIDELIAANHGQRSIYFAELPSRIPADQLEAAGPLWKLKE